jgi:hypothetical protein
MSDLNLKMDRMRGDCPECGDMAKAGATQEKLDEEHDNCHGWHHCGAGCCGGCPTCGG